MEEKLRNLSQNIANNTGPREANEPQERDEDRISDEELRDTPNDEGNERIDADFVEEDAEETPIEPNEGDEEYHENEERHEENDAHEDETPADEESEPVAINFNPVEEQEEVDDYTPDPTPEDTSEQHDDEYEQAEAEEEYEEEPEEQPKETEPAKAAILTMNEDNPKLHESSNRTKKYSPEVEAALSRISNEEPSTDLSEPLSTEPHKKHHDIGRILLFILFVLALAVGSICILVEQKIIDNPFPNLFKKESSEVQPADDTKPTEKYLPIDEWGIKILKPAGIGGFWYETINDKPNEVRIFGADSNYAPDETAEDEGANAVMSLIRSTNDTLQYSDTLTLSPITSISGYYYYLTFISGEMEDEIVQVFNEKLLNNNQSILAL
ncbi:hypothetical protein IKG06_03065 [Candidatus Saccharibacteria bacterium]|nr:hypothetical protein [Candidatus Saccharibacteria bacterium]